MYNVIFSIIDIRDNLTEEQSTFFKKTYDFNADIPEWRHTNWESRIMYQANIGSITQLEEIKAMLEQLDSPRMIGLWQTKWVNKWLQQGYIFNIIKDEEWLEISREVIRNKIFNYDWLEIDEPIYSPFNFEEYYKYLKDIVTYNEESWQEIERRRPTIEEARNTQVNSFGLVRDLFSY